MAYEFKLPDLGEGLTEGEVARWLVAEGDEIAEDQPLVEIQTDKTTVEIPSPAAGAVLRIFVAEGDVVPVGTVLVAIGAEGDEVVVAQEARPESVESATLRSPSEISSPREQSRRCRRRRSSGGSRPSSASTSRPSRRRARVAV
jgi:pyruvate/2-oxoglutarate dehydrogenase complex dihydrolipoamide acyltransferase (E2) component